MGDTVMLGILLFITLTISSISCAGSDILKKTEFPPCKACKVFVESFNKVCLILFIHNNLNKSIYLKGVDRTAKGKFEGGDAVWEEEKLGSYANSEIRLVEIQEKVCLDIAEGNDQCYSLQERYESIVEDWWFNCQENKGDLFTYLCVEYAHVCCPDLHFGKNCTPCKGYPDNVCSNNGKCKGSGTRKGNGKCTCDEGYAASECNICADMYFEAYRDDNKLLCSKCPPPCKGSCTKNGIIIFIFKITYFKECIENFRFTFRSLNNEVINVCIFIVKQCKESIFLSFYHCFIAIHNFSFGLFMKLFFINNTKLYITLITVDTTSENDFEPKLYLCESQ